MAASQNALASSRIGLAPAEGVRVPAAGAAALPAATAPLVRDCWEQAVDMNSGQPYWFNRAMGISQWFPPPGWDPPAPAGGPWHAAPQQSAARPIPESGRSAAGGQHEAGGAAPQQSGPAAQAGEAGGAQAVAAAATQQAQRPAGQKQHSPQPQQVQQAQRQYQPGLYYRDPYGLLQGPFTLEDMRSWRGMLPMNLPVLRLCSGGNTGSGGSKDASQAAVPAGGRHGGAGAQAGITGEGGAASEPARAQGQQEEGQAGEQQTGQPAAVQQPEKPAAAPLQEGSSGKGPSSGSAWEQLDLAGLLGDEELLARWRLENPEQEAWFGTAPPAALYEAERARGTAHSLAEAVLNGLPAHDEAVAVARVAAAAGRSIQEVVEWSRAVDYSSTAYRVAARGRVQAGGGQESLYAEAASWIDPASLEQQLARAADKRKRSLTGKELRAVKQHKTELKEKKRREWLLS